MPHSPYMPLNQQFHHQSSDRGLDNVKPLYRRDSTMHAPLTKTLLNQKRLKDWHNFAASLGKSQSSTSVILTRDSSNSHLPMRLSGSTQSNDQASQTHLGAFDEYKLQPSHNMQDLIMYEQMQQQSLERFIEKDLTCDLDKALLVNDIFRQIDLLRTFYNQAQDRYEEEVRKMLLLEQRMKEAQEANLRYETELTNLELELHKEYQLRQSSKVKAFEAEAKQYLIKEEIKNLDQLKQLRHGQTRDLKCKKCGEKPIVVAILPCFHASLCEGCADLVSKCTACNKSKLGVQKIFIG